MTVLKKDDTNQMRDEAEKKMSPTENVVQLSLVNNLKNLLEYKQTKSISLVKMNFHQ